jgi:hypothetical protein
MAVRKIQGMTLAFGTTLAASKSMSAVSNANPGVATLEASHGVIAGDIMLITSGWTRLNNRVIRAGTVATNNVNLDGVNTTSTSDYPAGEGVGSIQEVTAWTTMTQIRYDGVRGGGGGNFETADFTEVGDTRRRNVPTLAQAVTLGFDFNWDANLAWLSTLLAIARAGTLTPFRWVVGGATIYGAGYLGLQAEPNPQNGILTGSLELGLDADTITYTS